MAGMSQGWDRNVATSLVSVVGSTVRITGHPGDKDKTWVATLCSVSPWIHSPVLPLLYFSVPASVAVESMEFFHFL